MKKRIVSALLALVLILSNFTGGGLIEHVHVEAAAGTEWVSIPEVNVSIVRNFWGSNDDLVVDAETGKITMKTGTMMGWKIPTGVYDGVRFVISAIKGGTNEDGSPATFVGKICITGKDATGADYTDVNNQVKYLGDVDSETTYEFKFEEGAAATDVAIQRWGGSADSYVIVKEILLHKRPQPEFTPGKESLLIDKTVTFQRNEGGYYQRPLFDYCDTDLSKFIYAIQQPNAKVTIDFGVKSAEWIQLLWKQVYSPEKTGEVTWCGPVSEINGADLYNKIDNYTHTYDEAGNTTVFNDNTSYLVMHPAVAEDVTEMTVNIKVTADVPEPDPEPEGFPVELTYSWRWEGAVNLFDAGNDSDGNPIISRYNTKIGDLLAKYSTAEISFDVKAITGEKANITDISKVTAEIVGSTSANGYISNSEMYTVQRDNGKFNITVDLEKMYAGLPADATYNEIKLLFTVPCDNPNDPEGGEKSKKSKIYVILEAEPTFKLIEKTVEPDPDACPNGNEHTEEGWVEVDIADVTTDNTEKPTTWYIPFVSGDSAYAGDTVTYCFAGTVVSDAASPKIRFYLADGIKGSENDLTASIETTVTDGAFKFTGTTNALTSKGDHNSANSFYFKNIYGNSDVTGITFTHIYYKINHEHTPGDTFGYDGKYHWTACDTCGKPIGDTKEEHNFADGSLKCSGCGYTHLENEVALDLKAAAAVNANAITFDEDGNAYIKAGAIGPGGVVSFDLGRNLELGQEVTFHILASVYGNAQARLWLMQGTTVDRISDITVLTDKEHKDNLYDFTVNIPVKDAENQGRTSAGSIAFKGIDNNVNFPEMTIYHIGVVYPGCEHPADKQVTQFDLKNHWKRCLVCNEIIKDTTTAHTMVDNKCSGCAFEHYPDEVAIELTDENINSGNDGAITYEEGAVKVASNSVEWMNFNIGRTLLVGEKISVHIIGNIVAGSANQNGYLRAWLGDSGNKSEQCTDINKTSDGTFYNGYFQVKREFECTASTNAVALKANDYNTKLPELVIEHVAVVVPKCPHYTDSPNHDAWLAGNYTEYTIASSVPGKYGCHDLVCTLCGEIIETEQHTPNEDGYKDTGDGENHTYTCVCGSVITGTHREGTEIEYGNDDTNHWSLCADCGGKIDSTVAEHVLTYKDNGDGSTHTATCDTCGYKNESEAHVESQNKYDEDDVGRYHVCEYCNARLDKTEHHYVFVDDKNGTTHHEECETCHHKKAGSTEEHDYKDGKCSKCDYNHPEDEHVWSSWTPDLGGTTHTRTCSICGKEDTDPHNLPEEWTPSSEDETKHLKKCPDCGYEVTGEHNFGDSYEYVDAETHMQTCADCKKTVTSSHNYEEGKYSNSTTDHWQICKDCKGESDRENHKYVDGSDRCSVCNYWNHQHTLEWKDDGENHWQECSNPDCDYKTEKEPHVLGDSYDYNTTQHSRTCSVCHAKISKDHDLVDKYDNDFHWQECKVCDYETRATRHTLKTGSDENGHWEYCENCEYKSDPVAHTPEKELGHDADSHWSICSVCGEVYGKTAHTPSDELKHDSEGHWTVCSACGYENTEKKEAHTWDTGKVTVEPTETTEGEKTYTCTECGETKTESVPKSSHTHVAGKEWKHDEKTHWHECVSETCNDKTAKLDEAEHVWDDGKITVEPTYTKEGEKTYTCTECGETKTESVPKSSHTHVAGEEWKHDEKTHWHECVSETCDDKTAKLDEAEHVWDDGKVTVEPTYTKEGEKLYTCEVCGETKTETVPVKGHEHSTVTKSDEKGHWKECTICGETVGEVEAHTPGEWITDSEATSTEAGKRHKECTVCGYVTDVLEVPATGDIDVEVPTVGNVPKVELPAEQQEVLKNAVIDEEDVEAIESGASIDIELTVENAESTIAPEDKAVSDEAAVQGNYTHVRYLDINLTKVVTDASGASTSEEISELGKEVKIVITVPLALAKPNGRDFAVIRVHDGEAAVLKDLDSDPNTVTISTNLFSSYTLVYVDTTLVPSTPGGLIGHVHVITGLQNDAHYHWRGCFICSMRVDYEPHRFIDGVCTVCHYRDPDYVPEVEEEEPAEEAPDTEVTVVDAPTEGTEQGGDSEGTPEVTDTPANLPETEAEVVEVKEDDETSENPKTGVVFTGIGAVMAALAALVAKRK